MYLALGLRLGIKFKLTALPSNSVFLFSKNILPLFVPSKSVIAIVADENKSKQHVQNGIQLERIFTKSLYGSRKV